MIYIRTNSDNMVTFLHRKPFDPVNGLNTTKEELLKTGFLVDSIPEPNTTTGNRAVLYYNPELKKAYYKYSAAQLPIKERLELLESAMNEQLLASMQVKEEEDITDGEGCITDTESGIGNGNDSEEENTEQVQEENGQGDGDNSEEDSQGNEVESDRDAGYYTGSSEEDEISGESGDTEESNSEEESISEEEDAGSEYANESSDKDADNGGDNGGAEAGEAESTETAGGEEVSKETETSN